MQIWLHCSHQMFCTHHMHSINMALLDSVRLWVTAVYFGSSTKIEGLRERTEHLDIFLFPPITQW